MILVMLEEIEGQKSLPVEASDTALGVRHCELLVEYKLGSG